MKSTEILKQTMHRPFKYPDHSWMFYQEWNKAIFLHWQVTPALIKTLLPNNLEVDIKNNKTWISLVAFDMNNISFKKLPKPPYISDFQEINIRVYVRYNGKPGVYFLSMEANKKSSCLLLKTISKLPYRFSNIERQASSFKSENNNFNDTFHIEFEIENYPIKKDETDLWLTERYAVFQNYKNYIIGYDVHHIAWPTQKINIKTLQLNYPRFDHLINDKPHKIHYSTGVQVLTWNKKKLKT